MTHSNKRVRRQGRGIGSSNGRARTNAICEAVEPRLMLSDTYSTGNSIYLEDDSGETIFPPQFVSNQLSVSLRKNSSGRDTSSGHTYVYDFSVNNASDLTIRLDASGATRAGDGYLFALYRESDFDFQFG